MTSFCLAGRSLRESDVLEERFWSKVDRRCQGECWNWLAGRNSGGYGVFIVRGKNQKAHRVAWELTNGPLPPKNGRWHGICACHRCDNRLCCNPNHLFLGTQQDNMLDCVGKGRHAGAGGHPRALNPDQELDAWRMIWAGVPKGKVAECFGCSPSAIKRLIQRAA